MANQYGVHSAVVDVSAQGSFPTPADVTADFNVGRWVFSIDGAAGDEVRVSFDGTTVHGYLKAGAGSGDLILHTSARKVWIKKGTAAGTLKVICHADQDD
jgi:hypothetical protein